MGEKFIDLNEQVGGSSNTSAVNTCAIDWLEFSLVESLNINIIIKDILGVENNYLTHERRSFYNYQSIFRNFDKSMTLLTENAYENIGHKVIITGRFCQENQESLIGIINRAKEYNADFKRIDLTFDIKDGSLDIKTIERYIKRGSYTSCFKSDPIILKSYDKEGENTVKGSTVQLGSRKSNLYLRIYDKGLQMASSSPCVRFEIEAKKAHADKIAQSISSQEDIQNIFFGILPTYLTFREKTSDKNRARWPVVEWWSRLIQNPPKFVFSNQAGYVSTEEEKTAHFIKTYAKRLAICVDTYGFHIIPSMYKTGKESLMKEAKYRRENTAPLN